MTAAVCRIGYRKLQYDKIVTASVPSSTLFVDSLIHVPLGPSSVHLPLTASPGWCRVTDASPNCFRWPVTCAEPMEIAASARAMACSTSDGEALNANDKAVALAFAQGAIDKLENKVGSK